MTSRHRARRGAAAVAAVLCAGCSAGHGDTTDRTVTPVTAPGPTTGLPVTTEPTPSAPSTPGTPGTLPATTEARPAPTTSPSTEPTSTTEPAEPTSTTEPTEPAAIEYTALRAASAGLVDGNIGVSVAVWRHGAPDFSFTSGTRTDGTPIDRDSQFVLASVSKLVTAISVARLVELGQVDLAAAVPWTAMGVRHDPSWDTVTVRELLAHTSGMPEARATWLDDPGPCSVPLEEALATPPTDDRGTWHYSNGNYCALGLLVSHVTGLDLAGAAQQLVFGPAGVEGPFLSTEGARGSSVPYAKGLARLARLGGAGTWLASPDDIAAMLAAVTADDLVTLAWPGIILDQYGWGHTGSVDGAAACAWVLQGGDTVVTAFVSGPRPNTGGKVCDAVVPALAADLGIWAGEPARTPD